MDTSVIELALTDQEVIVRILEGETNLFERLIRKYNPRLYRVGMAIINNDTEIEDVMQNAYIKAFQGLAKFENRSSFGTWLTRILVNECLQFLKKNKHLTSLESINTNTMLNEGLSANDKKIPDNVTLNRELAHALEVSILQLPEKYRLVFVMREMENMSTAETVDVLNITETNMKVRLNRAKAMLRDKLNSYYKSDFLFHFYLTRCDRVAHNVMHKLLL